MCRSPWSSPSGRFRPWCRCPGLAVSPIMGDLNKIFPHVSNLEIQMLTSIPSVLIIPFILLSGRLSVARNKIALLRAGLAIFFISGVACLFARTMTQLIAVSCILGIGAGIVIPLSTGLVVRLLHGRLPRAAVGHKLRREQPDTGIGYGIHGYLAGVDWHLPFLVYTLPVVTLLLTGMAPTRAACTRAAAERPVPTEEHQPRTSGRTYGIYFFITFSVLVITFYTSFLVRELQIQRVILGTCHIAILPCHNGPGPSC